MKLLFKTILTVLAAGVIVATPFANKNLFKKNYTYRKSKILNEKECSFCHNDIIKHKNTHPPVTDDCLNCHQSTGTKHPGAKTKDFTLVEKTPDLCYICHEPKNEKNNVHYPVKEEECKSCHSPHGTDNNKLLYKSSENLVCLQCHELNFKEKNNIHAPVELDGCRSCHDAHQSDYPNLLKQEKPALCIICHDNIGIEKQAEFQHPPFDDDCANCHNPHNSKENFLLNESEENLCFTCHDDIQTILNESKYTHKVSQGKNNCNSCHSPHASKYNKILKKEQTTLCLNCHDKKINTEEKTIENIKLKISNAAYKHPPLEDGCNTCHNPHGSQNISLLTDKFPESEYVKSETENFALCFNCHDTELLEKETSETATNFRNGNKNLHYVHINGNKGRNCNLCHDMHASKNKFLIKKRTKFGTWDMPLMFKINKNGGSCNTGCHTEKKYDRTSPVKYGLIQPKDTADNTVIAETDTVSIEKKIKLEEDMETERDTFIAEKITVKKDTVLSEKDSNPENNIAETKPDTILETKIFTEKDTAEKKEPVTADNETHKTDTVNINKGTLRGNNNKIVEKENKTDTVKISYKENEEVKNNKVTDNSPDKNKETKKTAFEEFESIKNIKFYFEFGGTELSSPCEKKILKIYDFLKKYPDISIIVCGHTDNIGSKSFNLNLSKKRAEKIKKLLISKGILPKRIKIKAYGESAPSTTNETEKGRAENRRAEIKLKT